MRLVLISCMALACTPTAAPPQGTGEESIFPCRVFWHPKRTSLAQRGEAAEFLSLREGEGRSLGGEWEKRGARFRCRFLEHREGRDLYSVDGFVYAETYGTQELHKTVSFVGKRVVVFEDRFHLITMSPLQTPPVQSMEYPRINGGNHSYVVQAPDTVPDDAGIVIYMHGANQTAQQGMTLFPDLRVMLARKQWVYVSPADYEFDVLLQRLFRLYGKRRVFLAGASAGGRAIFQEACRHPERYSGLFLIGPALYWATGPRLGDMALPTYLVFGDKDGKNTTGARQVIQALSAKRIPCKYRVIKGGGHSAPYGNQDWWQEALPFVTGVSFEPEDGDAREPGQ